MLQRWLVILEVSESSEEQRWLVILEVSESSEDPFRKHTEKTTLVTNIVMHRSFSRFKQ